VLFTDADFAMIPAFSGHPGPTFRDDSGWKVWRDHGEADDHRHAGGVAVWSTADHAAG